MVARDIKLYPPPSFAGLSAISPIILCFVLLVVPMYTCTYAPNIILSLLSSGFGDPRMMVSGLRLLDIPFWMGAFLNKLSCLVPDIFSLFL